MPRQANGNYLPPANTAAVSGGTISSTAFNTLETDIGTEITNSLDRQGRSAMQAPLPMGSNKITGMADPTVSTDAATKNYVDSTASFTTGDMKLTMKNAPDTGWIFAAGPSGHGFIGNVGSGTGSAVNRRANADCVNLFTLIFNNYSDANAPLFTSGGGATTRAGQVNVATAWAANCQMQIGFFAARALGISANPSDLPTNRNLGDHLGAETFTLASGNIPTITAINAAQSITVAGPSGHTVWIDAVDTSMAITGGVQHFPGGGVGSNSVSFTGSNSISTTYTNGSPTAVSQYQPTTFVNVMVKL